MESHGIQVVYAALLWWSTTGLILRLTRLPRRSHHVVLLAATVVLAIGLFGLSHSATRVDATGAFLAFTSAILVWSWIEIGFLLGFVTGPRRDACHAQCGGWRHFVHAVGAILYHELAIIAAAAAVYLAVGDGPNRFGLWTFLVLWVMRQSAKLNLFFGVPNLGEQYLPAHLQYLKDFFRRRPMNLLFPVSVTGGTVLLVLLVLRLLDPAASEFDGAGYGLLATLLGLAVLEHWFLVLPLPSEALWRWSLRERTPDRPHKAPVVLTPVAARQPWDKRA